MHRFPGFFFLVVIFVSKNCLIPMKFSGWQDGCRYFLKIDF
jgi:hypothetical protein